MNVKQFLRIKQADTINEQAAGGISNMLVRGVMGGSMLNPTTSLASSVGSLAGYLSPAATIKELKEYNSTPAVGLLPGASAYRAIRRRKATEKMLKDPSKNNSNMIWHEEWGPLAQFLGAGTLGGILGYNYYKSKPKQELIDSLKKSELFKDVKDKNILKIIEKYPAVIKGSKGLAIGGAAIAGLNALGLGLGFLGETPTAKERRTYLNNKNNILKNYLIPGYSWYQSTRNARYTDNFK